MKHRNLLAIIALGSGVATGAQASVDLCFVPISEWQPRHAVKEMVERKGWKLRRIKVDDGCYEFIGLDEKGNKIEAEIDPASLAVIRIKVEEVHVSDPIDKNVKKKNEDN